MQDARIIGKGSSDPSDETRKPEWYDGIYNYLKNIGIKEKRVRGQAHDSFIAYAIFLCFAYGGFNVFPLALPAPYVTIHVATSGFKLRQASSGKEEPALLTLSSRWGTFKVHHHPHKLTYGLT